MNLLREISDAFMGTLLDLINDNNETPIVQILLKDNRYLYISLLISIAVIFLQ